MFHLELINDFGRSLTGNNDLFMTGPWPAHDSLPGPRLTRS